MFVEIGTSSGSFGKVIVNYSKIIPMLLILGSYFTWDIESVEFQENCTFYFLALGLIFGLNTSKLIVSTMAKVSLLY